MWYEETGGCQLESLHLLQWNNSVMSVPQIFDSDLLMQIVSLSAHKHQELVAEFV